MRIARSTRRWPSALGVACLLLASAAGAEDRKINTEKLTHLVRQDCGSCHGLTLKGGLGPSLEAAALAGKDAEALGFVILHGRRGTPMPPWREHLTEPEARWIVEQLQKGFPE